MKVRSQRLAIGALIPDKRRIMTNGGDEDGDHPMVEMFGGPEFGRELSELVRILERKDDPFVVGSQKRLWWMHG